jgi:transcriptional regulator with XRE-family HTH domain
MFGDFIKQKRLEKELSLREFCKQLNEDASNWSKVERGKLAPPQDEQKLEKIARVLEIEKGTSDWQKLTDYAAVDAGKIPEYLMNDKEVMEVLPIFLRTIGSVKPTPEELAELIDIIRKER